MSEPKMVRAAEFSSGWDVHRLSLPAPGKGHDAVLVADGFAGVSDGATPLGDCPGRRVLAFAADSHPACGAFVEFRGALAGSA